MPAPTIMPESESATCLSCEKRFLRANLDGGICARCVEIDGAIGEEAKLQARNRPQCSCGLTGWGAFDRSVSITLCKLCLKQDGDAGRQIHSNQFDIVEKLAREQASAARLRSNQGGVPKVNLNTLHLATANGVDAMTAAAAAANSMAVPSITAQVLIQTEKKYQLWPGTIVPDIIECGWSITMQELVKMGEKQIGDAWGRAKKQTGMRGHFRDHAYTLCLSSPTQTGSVVRVGQHYNPTMTFYSFWETLCVSKRLFLPAKDVVKGGRTFRMLFLITLDADDNDSDVQIIEPPTFSNVQSLPGQPKPTLASPAPSFPASLGKRVDGPSSATPYGLSTFSFSSALRSRTNHPTPRHLIFTPDNYRPVSYDFDPTGEGLTANESRDVRKGGFSVGSFASGSMKHAHNFRPNFDDPTVVDVVKYIYRLDCSLPDGVDLETMQQLLSLETRAAVKLELLIDLFYKKYDIAYAKSKKRSVPRLRALRPRLIIVVDETGREKACWLAERKCDPSAFQKITGSDPFVKTTGLSLLEEDVLGFLHFVHDLTAAEGLDCTVLYADIQGFLENDQSSNGCGWFTLTDILSHTPAGDSGMADGGLDDVRLFANTHHCSATCRKLKLAPPTSLEKYQLPAITVQPRWKQEIARRLRANQPQPRVQDRSGGASGGGLITSRRLGVVTEDGNEPEMSEEEEDEDDGEEERDEEPAEQPIRGGKRRKVAVAAASKAVETRKSKRIPKPKKR